MKKGKFQHGKESEREGKAWGRGEFANMPKEVSMAAYPKAHEAGPGYEDDTITRIDGENGRAQTKTKRYLSNQH